LSSIKVDEYTKTMDYLTKTEKEPIVYLLQEVPGTKIGVPKYNIIGAQKFGKIKVLLREETQIVRSPGPITYQLRRLLKDFTDKDYLLLSGDPKVIGLSCSIACDINNGKYKTLTWDRQEKMYYPTEFNIHERGEIDEQDKL
jgi:hypothetical protein